MKISSSDLINLPVYTQGGQYLGKVDSLDIDIDTHTITHYHIRTGLIKGLWHQQLIVHQSQVISISKEKMIVEDNTSRQPIGEVELATPVAK